MCIRDRNNFLSQLADFNYLNIGGMSFWTPHVILISDVYKRQRFWSMRSRQRTFLTILFQNPFSLLMEKKLTNQLSLITRKFPDMESCLLYTSASTMIRLPHRYLPQRMLLKSKLSDGLCPAMMRIYGTVLGRLLSMRGF